MIAVIAAMNEEVTAMVELLSEVQTQTISNTIFHQGKYGEKDVIVMQSGIGKTLSAMATTILLENFTVECVINIGTAGGLSSAVKSLDVVIAERVAQADYDITAFPGRQRNFDEEVLSFKPDAQLLALAHKLALTRNNVVFGDMVSCDQFIHLSSQVEEIFKFFPTAIACEMEAGSIAAVLSKYQLPFIVIRSISDVVGNDDNSLEFYQFLALASKESAKLAVEFIEDLI